MAILHASIVSVCLRESSGWRWKERARELNGVLVRAVGSSGSMARRRLCLRDSPSVEREIVGQVVLATTSKKKENEGKERNEKCTRIHADVARRARKARVLNAAPYTGLEVSATPFPP